MTEMRFDRFEACDSVPDLPRANAESDEYLATLREFLASGQGCARVDRVDTWIANSAAQAFRSRAKRNALPVRVCKRGTFVYLEAI